SWQFGAAANHVPDTADLRPGAAAVAAAGLFQQRHFQRFPDLSAGIVSDADSRDRRRFLFQRGRVLASTGPFVTGYLVTVLGSFGRAASAVAAIYIVGLLILPFAPETKGKP